MAIDLCYWIVIVYEDVDAELLGPFNCQAELVDRLRALYGKRVCVFPFQGNPINISNGPLRYMIPTEGAPVPLFDEPSVTVDPTGALFDDFEPPNDQTHGPIDR